MINNELSCVFKLVVELNSELKFVSKYYGSYYFRKTVDTENFIKIYIFFFYDLKKKMFSSLFQRERDYLVIFYQTFFNEMVIN